MIDRFALLSPFVLAVGLALGVALLVAVVVLVRENGRLRRQVAVGVEPGDPAVDGADLLERVAAVSHRLAATHPLSGLPVREALLAHMAADGRGLLGAIAFADFDRLTAFDPTLAEHMFATATARLRAMLPRERFVAQVDRGQVGLWFGQTTGEAEARAELDAVSYALGEEIAVGGRNLTPQIKVRLARFDADGAIEANAFVARTLASFTLAAGAAAQPEATSDFADLAQDRYALEQDLRQAIFRRELRLEYQPLVDAGAGRVSGAEALIRWDHPGRGAISPTRFIPIVEAMGLASEIGMWALNTAARQANEWRAAGLDNLRVAVNVSGLQLERDDLPILVQRTLERHELGPTALEIELTESVATSDADHCRHIFQGLRAMGVKLAVDDFGTGYSGFSSLRTLAFDKIKIDREFITDVDRRPDSQAICQSIIALGRGLGIRVLAEGVERAGEYAWLRRHGCHHFQGFYFARPLSGEAFAAFVRDRATLTKLLTVGGMADIETRLMA
ncbi:MAG: EAL domain-containing protein [Sphingomonas sp.]|uniref:putative bifunctional diguanylate cyclase/phosphodiesterase n=1 Tax=Sphingomonas sp. TaxID=28214 RepID=UPI001AC4955F|nr:EAL domain-containing protein [Sphingomonas sp.]MBN8809364.1 EAL domain-containing protein [Sphingomonas sp.]